MGRKIVQIAVEPATMEYPAMLYALCEDGTVWSRVALPGEAWRKVSGVPEITDQSTPEPQP